MKLFFLLTFLFSSSSVLAQQVIKFSDTIIPVGENTESCKVKFDENGNVIVDKDEHGNVIDDDDKLNIAKKIAAESNRELTPDQIDEITAGICNKSVDDIRSEVNNLLSAVSTMRNSENLIAANETPKASTEQIDGLTTSSGSGCADKERRLSEFNSGLEEYEKDYLTPNQIEEITSKICKKSVEDLLSEAQNLINQAKAYEENDQLLNKTEDGENITTNNHSLDGNGNDNDTSNCWVKGNHLFASNCNVFNGNPVIADRNILELGNIYVFTDFESVSQMRAEDPEKSCKTCMEKVYKTFTDKKSVDYEKEIDKVADKLVQKLKPKNIVPNLLNISKTIEDITRATALYQNSIDRYLSGVDDADKQEALQALQCPNTDELLEVMKSKCGETGFKFKDAEKHLKTAFAELGFENNEIGESFNSLKKESTSKSTSSCDHDLSIGDYQSLNFLSAITNEKNEPDSTETNLVYSALDKVLTGDKEAVVSMCEKFANNPNFEPSWHQQQPGKFLEYQILGSKRLKGDAKKAYEDVKEIFSKNSAYNSTDYSTVEDSSLIIFTKATNADPNLRMLLSDWKSFCSFQESFEKDNSEASADNPIKSKRLVRGEIEKVRPESLDKEQAQRIIDYAKTRCGAAYSKIAEVACYAGSDVTSPLLSKYHLEEASRELHQELEAQANANSRNANKKEAEMVLLSGLMCSKMNFSKSSIILNDPNRRLGTYGFSDFSSKKLQDGIAKGKYCWSKNGQQECSLVIPEYGPFTTMPNKVEQNICNESEANKSALLYKVYGTQPDTKTYTDHFARNIETYSENDPEFVQGMINDGHLDNYPGARNRAERLIAAANGVTNKPGTGSIVGPSPSGFSSTEMSTSNSSNDKSLVNSEMESQINKNLQRQKEFEESEANKVLDNAISNSGGDIEKLAAEWEKEKADLMKKHEEELKALREQIANAQKDPASLPPKELDALQDRVDKLLKEKEAIGMGDEIIKNLEKVAEENGEKGKLENKVSPSTIQKKKDEVIAGSTSTSFPAGSGASGNRANLPNSINYIPRSVYQDGVGGYVFVQDNDLAEIQLEDLGNLLIEGRVSENDIKFEFINANGLPKLVKIPGYTSGYIEIDQVKTMLESRKSDKNYNGELDYLIGYLEMASKGNKGKDPEGKKAEVMLVSIDEANDAPARLRDMKYAMNELMTFREACAENIKDKADMIALSLQSSTDPETAIFGKAFQCE
jgi:hypothetical protein